MLKLVNVNEEALRILLEFTSIRYQDVVNLK